MGELRHSRVCAHVFDPGDKSGYDYRAETVLAYMGSDLRCIQSSPSQFRSSAEVLRSYQVLHIPRSTYPLVSLRAGTLAVPVSFLLLASQNPRIRPAKPTLPFALVRSDSRQLVQSGGCYHPLDTRKPVKTHHATSTPLQRKLLSRAHP